VEAEEEKLSPASSGNSIRVRRTGREDRRRSEGGGLRETLKGVGGDKDHQAKTNDFKGAKWIIKTRKKDPQKGYEEKTRRQSTW